MQIGNIIKFGDYDWRVMDIDSGRAFLVSDGIVGLGKYHKEFSDITWEHCSLRKNLNGKFLKSFSAAERARIIETKVNNLNNPTHGTKGGKATKDFVFLLSYDEARRFFPSDETRTVIHNGSAHWWWLRTLGQNSARAMVVKAQGGVGIYANGALDIPGERIAQDGGGIRPAMWIKI